MEFRQINRTELYLADEAFFAGTGAQIAPIGLIDNYAIGNAKVGPITLKLQEIHRSVCQGENPKYADQLTPIDYHNVLA